MFRNVRIMTLRQSVRFLIRNVLTLTIHLNESFLFRNAITLTMYLSVSCLYTQLQKKREKFLLLNWLKIKYVEFKKCILHVKLTVYYTVSFTCNIHFLNSTLFYFQSI